MPNTHDVGDIALYTIGGQNLLAFFEGVTYSVQETQVDGSSLLRDGMSPNGTKLEAKISTNLLSTFNVPDRVSHLDLSVFQLGSTSYLAVLKSLEMQGKFTQAKRAGVGAWWKRPQNVKKDYSFMVELDCDDGVAAAIMVAMHSTDGDDRNTVVNMNLNGVTIPVPGRIQQAEHGGERNGLQTMKLTVNGRDPGTGAYPTAPTETVSLLGQAINAWKSPLAFAYASHQTAGFQVSGNMVFNSFSFKVEDEALVKNAYAFDSFGTVGASASGS